MQIKKTDTKGRITVGTKGEAYSQTTQPDGTIILKPLIPPKPPVMPEDAPHAVYVDYQLQSDGLASTLTLHAESGRLALGNQAITLAQTNGNIPIVMCSSPEDPNQRGLALHIRQSLENRGLADAIDMVEIEPTPAEVMCDAEGNTDKATFRKRIIEGFPKVDPGTILNGKVRLLHFGEGINWLPPVEMEQFFARIGIEADRIVEAEITDMPTDYQGTAKMGLLVTLLAKPHDSSFFRGITANDGEPATFRAVIPLVPRAPRETGSLAHVPEERQPDELSQASLASLAQSVATNISHGKAANHHPNADAPSLVDGQSGIHIPSDPGTLDWDAANACPWNCSFRHVHVARRSRSEMFWRPKSAGELRRTHPNAEPTDGTERVVADKERGPLNAESALKFIDMKVANSAAGALSMFDVSVAIEVTEGPAWTRGYTRTLPSDLAIRFIKSRKANHFFVKRAKPGVAHIA